MIGKAIVLPLPAKVLSNLWREQQPFSPRVKQMIATALGELRDRTARPILEELVQSSDRKVQLHAQSALRKLA